MADTILFTSEQIKARVQELALTLSQDYKGKKPLLIGILNGSVVFMADLIRALYTQGLTEIEIDFMTVSSYGKETKYSGVSTIVRDIVKDINGRDVILVEDIIDTGHTLAFVRDYFLKKNPASFKIVAFLDKAEKREVEVPVDYIGFRIEGKSWIEGYGLDGGKYGRGRSDIAAKEGTST